ncbi:tetratricopeptide repeat-containing sensor histidine kinase [Reichenbachiella sp.]|uniref:tetratricopeptide repeat-containing sensor histidine kinase n=1 Tax=Reichenbachiella sp. TaxID=2184521 RepID=UPI003BB00C23
MNLYKRTSLVFFFLVLSFSGYAQLDSLKLELETAIGEKRIDVLNKIAFTFGYSKFDSARYYGEMANEEAIQLDYLDGKVKSYVNIGYSYFDEGKLDTAMILMKRSIAESIENGYPEGEMDGYLALGIVYDSKSYLDSAAWAYRKNIAMGKSLNKIQKSTSAIGNLGNVYRQQGLFDMAIAQYLEAAELNLELGKAAKQANFLANVGSVYLEDHNFEKAEEYSAKAYELVKDSDYTRTKWYARTGQCLALGNLDRYDEALVGFNEILEEAKTLGDPYQVPTVYHNLGDLFNDNGEHEKALESGLAALKGFEVVDSKYGILKSHTLLCTIYGKMGQVDKALSHCKLASEMAHEFNHEGSLKEIYKYQAEAFETVAKYKEAYAARLRYEEVKDEQLGETQDRHIAALTTKFDTKEKELKIEVQEEKLEAQEKLIDQQRIIQALILLVLLVVVIMAVIIWRNGKKQKEVNKQLNEQKETIEKTSKERETLLKEIHHRVKNNLQVISSLLSMQSRQMDEGEAKSAVREGQSRIKSMSLIHQKLYSQDELSRINMKEYISELSQYLFKSYKMGESIKEVLETQEIQLDVDTAVPLGLIINELIANALKYAFEDKKQGELKVQFAQEDNFYKLKVSDDGVGLPSQWEKKKNMGMRLVQILVEQLDGELAIENSNGTTFMITFGKHAA